MLKPIPAFDKWGESVKKQLSGPLFEAANDSRAPGKVIAAVRAITEMSWAERLDISQVRRGGSAGTCPRCPRSV